MITTRPTGHTVEEIAVGNLFDTVQGEAWAVMDGAAFALALDGRLPIYRDRDEAEAYNRDHYRGRGALRRVRILLESAR